MQSSLFCLGSYDCFAAGIHVLFQSLSFSYPFLFAHLEVEQSALSSSFFLVS